MELVILFTLPDLLKTLNNEGGSRRSENMSLDRHAEKRLAERAAKGDQKAFRELYQETSPMAHSIVRRFGLKLEGAEDAVQDAFFAAFSAISRFQYRSRFSTWFFRFVLRKAQRHLRNERSKQAGQSRLAELKHICFAQDSFERVASTDMKSAIQDFVKTLKQDDRQMIVMIMNGCALSVIAKALNISDRTADNRWKILKEQLKGPLKKLHGWDNLLRSGQ
jgi:RNA polymerase sigma-70 factor (ECF subfamily)